MRSLTGRPHKRLSQKQLRQRLHTVRRQQSRKARVARRRLERIHDQLPKQVRTIFDPLEPAFSRPIHRRFVLLALAAILTLGGRTITNLLRVLGIMAPGHPSSYHRVFSRDRWSLSPLARRYVAAVLARFAPRGPILLAGDDTVTEHPGPHVYGKGRHRDPVRSTHTYTAFRWGHKWVVLALLVPVPWATRRWALPLLVALYRPKEENLKRGQRHKTPPQLLGQMVRLLRRWFPDRTFVVTADGGYATHELAELATQAPRKWTLVSLFYPNANLVGPPPEYSGRGRPRVKGNDLPSPAEVAENTKQRQTLVVAWYGGGRRRVEVVTGTGLWYKSGRPLVELRWVFVHDLSGTHRDAYFFTTDVTMSVRSLIETYTGRWNVETTFEEVRSYLRVQTTRGWSRDTVLRTGPCLFGLYTIVAWLYAELPGRWSRVGIVDWPGKRDVTFSDAITVVRRWLWLAWILAIPGHRDAFQKLKPGLRQILLNGLAPAA
jgi:DDE superfamily endonuclease